MNIPPSVIQTPSKAHSRPALSSCHGLRLALAVAAFFGTLCAPAQTINEEQSILWGVMSWQNWDQAGTQPNPTTDTTCPLFMQGQAHLVTHMYQSPEANWLAARLSASNATEIQRIYGLGHAINLMIYFQNCSYNASTGAWGYPLSSQFLADFEDLVQAYSQGGGPLYIQVFPEFELWYSGRSEADQNAYRARIASHFAQMEAIAHSVYNKAYIGLCFQSRYLDDYGAFGTTWKNRWGPTLSISDVVFINPHDAWTNWEVQQSEIIQGSKGLWDNWGLPLAIPFGNLWGGGNNPPEAPVIFTVGGNYAQQAATYDTAIANWISRTWLNTTEEAPGTDNKWRTNLLTLKSRGLFAWSLFEDSYIRPATPPDPNGQTHTMAHFTTMKNTLLNGRDHLYPITEMEFWPATLSDRVPTTHPTGGGVTYSVTTDPNCSSGRFLLLNSTAMNQAVTFKTLVTHAGTYKIKVGIKRSGNRGTFQLAIGGAAQGGYVDCYTSNPSGDYTEVDLGNKTFTTRGIKDFKFTVMTRNAASTGFTLGLDYIKLIPQ